MLLENRDWWKPGVYACEGDLEHEVLRGPCVNKGGTAEATFRPLGMEGFLFFKN
jgi:hypothetical protein